MVPSIVNLDVFLEFMEQTVQWDKGNLSEWISGQHEMAIPKGTKTINNFSSFIRAAGAELRPTVKIMLEKFGEKGGGRSRAVSELRGMLCRCNNSDSSGHPDFLAHQILADVEDLFEDPIGPVVPDGVVAGHGGQLGFLMLKNHIGVPPP